MKWLERKAQITPKQGDSPIEKIAKIRGIKTNDIERFLSPTKEELHSPYLIKNIEKASERIMKAIKENEKILVAFDPDADGLTATAIMIRYLRNYTNNIDYIYGERNNGHGIYEMTRIVNNKEDTQRIERNEENVTKIKDNDLLIIIDSSTNDTETCRRIVENLNKDIIILDHHAIEHENPYVILVNPQQEGDEYPNKQLSGAGVVFKVMQVMEDTLGQVNPFDYIDLVAVGMYSDIMRVDVLENRFMIMHGLRNMKNTGLVRILKGAKADLYKLNCNSIGYTIAPILNGTCRMDNIKLAIDILLTDDDAVAKKLRLQMEKLNNTRKILQKTIVDQFMTKVNLDEKVLIVIDEQSSRGFNGVVAQQLVETYKRPAIVGRLHNGLISGSFRSLNNFDMKTFLNETKLIEEAMGHPQAGGITIKKENLDDLLTYINANLPELQERERVIVYDLEINASEIPEYIHAMERFNLLVGNGFQRVIVRVSGIEVEEVSCIGKTQETIKIRTLNELELIKFKVDENYASEIGIFDEIEVVGQLQVNEFYHFGLKKKIITNQIMIDDYRIS